MKIAILTSGILPIPAVQGGAVENLVDFYLEFNEQHRLHDITVYSVWNKKVTQHPALSSTANHYFYVDTTSLYAKVKRKIYHLFHQHEYYNHHIEYYFEEAFKDIKKHNFNLIILENRPGYAYKLAKRGKSNILLHLHNDLLNSETLYHQEIFNSLTHIITVSDFIKGRISTIKPNDKTQTIYNGIDLTRFSRKSHSTVSRNSIGFADTDFVLVFSGRINKDKGVKELIKAMLLLQDYPSIKLLIIGSTFFGNTTEDDEFIRSLKTLASPIKQRIIFTGFVPYDLMPNYLQIANAAVIPSVWDDPFPTTVLEAQAMGLPIITTNCGGIPEEIGSDNAIIVSRGHNFVSQFADAIRILYLHPEKCAIMAKASLLRSIYFNKERFSHDFYNIINYLKP